MNITRLSGFVVAAAVFIADQVVKALVVGSLGLRQIGDAREIVSFFDLRFVPNVGVSLGLFPAGSDTMRWALVTLTAAIAAGVAWWMLREKAKADLYGLALVLGGAVGNILDRIRFGYVIDYADLHFGEWRPFLVFNVADAAITIGVLILLVRALFVRDKSAVTTVSVEKANA
jgi:signal peptidase II